MKKFKVKLDKSPDRSYEILLEKGLFEKIPGLLKKKFPAESYAVVSDSNVYRIYGRKLVLAITSAGLKAYGIKFKAGENSKSLKTTEKLLDGLCKKRVTRSGCIIALGGGVTGDLAGLTASIYMRGIALIHVPTSLLAMVDSSIGGKTGANLTYGKNLAGTFYQPTSVLVDPNMLKTLPNIEFLNGFAEIVKYGIIADNEMIELLEETLKKHSFRNPGNLNKFIEHCVKIKALITSKDEKEHSTRIILNYGHTVGHAIESLTKYKINHGEAIIYGMRIANRIGYNTGILKLKDFRRINNLLNTLSRGRNITKCLSKICKKNPAKEIWEIMHSDKKMKKSKIRFVLAKTVGKTVIYDKVNLSDFTKAFENESK